MDNPRKPTATAMADVIQALMRSSKKFGVKIVEVEQRSCDFPSSITQLGTVK